MCFYLLRYYGEYQVTSVTIQNKNYLEIITYKYHNLTPEMLRCAVHKLTNWHIRQLSNTKGA